MSNYEQRTNTATLGAAEKQETNESMLLRFGFLLEPLPVQVPAPEPSPIFEPIAKGVIQSCADQLIAQADDCPLHYAPTIQLGLFRLGKISREDSTSVECLRTIVKILNELLTPNLFIGTNRAFAINMVNADDETKTKVQDLFYNLTETELAGMTAV